MTDQFLNDQLKLLMRAIEGNEDARARQIAEHIAAEGVQEGDLGKSGPGYILASMFTRAALSARRNGRPGEAAHLVERRARLCTREEVEDATLVMMFELGVRAGWLPADDYDRVDNYLADLTGPVREKWKTVQRKD